MIYSSGVSIVVPCYRHVTDCQSTVQKILEVFADCDHVEVIVIVDGMETDPLGRQSLEKMKHVFAAHEVHFFDFGMRLGKGGAIREGVLRAKGHIITFIDADSVIHPRNLKTMVGLLQQNPAMHIVIGTREKYHSSLVRKLLSYAFRSLNVALFFCLPWDTQAGIKAFRSTAVTPFFESLRTRGYAFDVEILLQARLASFQIGKVFVVQHMRGHSNVNAKSVLSMLREVIGLYFWFLPLEMHRNLQIFRLFPWIIFLRHIVVLPIAVFLSFAFRVFQYFQQAALSHR